MTMMKDGAPIAPKPDTRSFFETTLALLEEGKLNEYASTWENKTEHTLKTLVGLSRYEHQRAKDLGKSVFGSLMLVGCLISLTSLTLLCVFYGKMPDTPLKWFGALLGFACLFGMLIGAWAGFVCTPAANWTQRFVFKKGRGPLYGAELRRFSDALDVALGYLTLTHDDIVKLGRERVVKLAGNKLDAAARKIAQVEYQRRGADTREKAKEKGGILLAFEEEFDAKFSDFSTLKFEKRGYGTVLEAARRNFEAEADRVLYPA